MIKEQHMIELDGRVTRLFEDGSKWTQNRMAKNKEGWGVTVNSPHASCWCLLGAIQRCYGEDCYLVERVVCQNLKVTIPTFNDSSAYSAIMDFCRRINL